MRSHGLATSPQRIVRLLPLRDDDDILERNLDWYLAQGLETVVVDNGSGDRACDLCRQGVRDGRIAALERVDEPLESWAQIAERLVALAAACEPDIVVLAAADEFMESPDGTPLNVALTEDAVAGANLIRVSVVEFFMTAEDDASEPDPLCRQRRYSKRTASGSLRGARWTDGPSFDDPRRCVLRHGVPERPTDRAYLVRHYPLRSPEQAMDRSTTGRLRPMLAGSFAAPLRGIVEDPVDLVIQRPALLARYAEDHRWSEREGGGIAYLDNASRMLRRMRRSHRDLRREHIKLKREYGQVLLDRERLCAAAGTTKPAPIAASGAWYDERYRLNLPKYDIDPRESPYAATWQEILARLAPDDAVLEIGCGPGQLALLVREAGIHSYVGIDFSRYAIELARRRLPDGDLRVDDARTSTLVDGTRHSVVICTEVLEHLDDDLALLERVRTGTRILATVPNFDSTSHLRFFASAAAVRARYEAVLDELRVDTFALRRGSALFLMDGRAR